jgi:hypothetical protein
LNYYVKCWERVGLGEKTSFGNYQNFFFFFFLSHEPKLLPKLASPMRDENSQNIAYRYKTYIRRNQKKRKKKVSVGCKDRHYPKKGPETIVMETVVVSPTG